MTAEASDIDLAGLDLVDQRYLPAPSDTGPGRPLRRMIGVDEEILDWVPCERARYTRLGMVVLNTGLLAVLSMLVALGKVVNIPWALRVPAAAFWGFLILCFDLWVVASTHGLLRRSRLGVYLPRLLVSLLIGAFVGEPLLLWIFQPAIHTEIRTHRDKQLAAYESTLRSCNPPSGEIVAAARCAGLHLNIDDSPVVLQRQLDDLNTQRSTLAELVGNLSQQLADKQRFAQEECGGTTGPGLTGQRGVGDQCVTDRKVADEFRRDSRLEQHQADLASLDQKLHDLTAQLAASRGTYSGRVSAAIAAKVSRQRRDQGRIGLLDEDAALQRLSARSGFVLAGQWLVRLLLVVLDSLPVLTKLMSGATTYDRLVQQRRETSARLHDRNLGLLELRDTVAIDLASHEAERDRQVGRERLDDAERAARSRRETDLAAELDDLAARLLNQPPDPPLASRSAGG